MLKKMYRVVVEKYDYFGGDKTITRHFGTLLGAWGFYKKKVKFDFEYDDAYQHTRLPHGFFCNVEPENPHSFYTPIDERFIKVPVYGWDGTLIEKVTTTLKELRENDLALSLNNWTVNFKELCIRDAGFSLVDFIRTGEINFN